MNMTINLGADPRDRLARIEFKHPLPPSVDLLPDVFEVEDQGRLGSCTANAGCSALELCYKRAGKPQDFSRMFLYKRVRDLAGFYGDTGANPRDIPKALNQFGVCLETTWPYDADLLDTEPSPAAIAEAAMFKTGAYEMISSVQDFQPLVDTLKHSLAQGLPVLTTITVLQSFLTLSGADWRQHEFNTNSNETDQMLGLHEVLLIGYDDAAGRFLFQNSWGPAWGDGGFFGVPYDYLYGSFAVEYWVITEPGVPVIPVADYGDPVTQMYRQALRREPDSGGLAYWQSQTQRTAMRGICSSDEFYAVNLSVSELYPAILGRPADAGGLAYWTASGLSLREIASAFLASAEFEARYPDAVTTQSLASLFATKLVPTWVEKPGEHAGLILAVVAAAIVIAYNSGWI